MQTKAENEYLTDAFVAKDWAVILKWMLRKLDLENMECIHLSLKDPVITDGGPSCSIQSKNFVT